MTERNSVVAHFLDGTLIKGFIQDFTPHRPSFHVFPMDSDNGILISLSQLKAVFFVRDLAGNPTREDLRGFIAAPAESVHGRKIAVRFSDGEVMCGYSLSYSLRREGFFMFPADKASNNLRIYVMLRSATEVREGAEAQELAQKALRGPERDVA